MDTQKNPPPYEPVAPNAAPPPSAFQYNAAPPPPPPTYGFNAPATNFSAGHKFRGFFSTVREFRIFVFIAMCCASSVISLTQGCLRLHATFQKI